MELFARQKTVKMRGEIYYITEWYDEFNRLYSYSLDDIREFHKPLFSKKLD